MGFEGHLILNCDAYLQNPRTILTNLPRTLDPSQSVRPQRFARDEGCIDLRYTKNFSSLLATIRNHLLTSASTQSHYIFAAQEVYKKFVSNGVLKHPGSPPCYNNFINFVTQNWPTFRSMRGTSDKLIWGEVCKRFGSPNEVSILNSVICQAENVSPYFLDILMPNLLVGRYQFSYDTSTRII